MQIQNIRSVKSYSTNIYTTIDEKFEEIAQVSHWDNFFPWSVLFGGVLMDFGKNLKEISNVVGNIDDSGRC